MKTTHSSTLASRMRRSVFCQWFTGLAAMLALAVQPVMGATVYWDIDGTTAGAGGAAPAGTWDGVNAFWNTRYDGTGTVAAWLAGDTAVFAAGTNATGAYTVTVSGMQSIGGLAFEEGTVLLSGGTLDLGASLRDIRVAAGLSSTINSVLTGTGGGINKTGTGMLVLNAANNYTGLTQVTDGTLRLDFSAAGAPSTNILYNGVTEAGMTFGSSTVGGGATLSMIGAAGATSQTLGGITLNLSTGVNIAVDSTVGGATTLNLGNITRAANNGSSVRFTLPSSGNITSTAALSNLIIGPWASVGSGSTQRYATIASGNIAGFTGGTAITDINSATSATTNYDIATLTTGILTAARTANTIRVATAGASTIDLGASGAFNLAVNGLMNVSGGTLTIQRSGTSTGTLRAAVDGGDIVFSGSSQITVGGGVPISNVTAASRFVVNMDPGVILRIDTSATNTGGVVVNSGILELGNSNIGSATASTLTINNGGTVRTTSGTDAITGTTTVQINEGGTFLFNQNNTETLARLVGSGLLDRTDGGATARVITLSSSTAATWEGVIAGGSGTNVIGITKAGANVVTFTGNNTYTGASSITQSRWIISGVNGSLSGTASLAVGDNNGADEVLQLGDTADLILGTLNRYNYAGTMTLNGGGTLDLRGPALGSTGTTETVGALTISNGRNVVTLTQAAGGTVQLTAASLLRTNSGTALIRGAGLGSTGPDTTRVVLTTAPTGNNFIGSSTTAGALNLSIVPWLVGGTSATDAGSTFLTYDTNGLRPLTGAEYGTTLASNSTNNISLAGGEIFSVAEQNFSVNSLLLSGGTTTGDGGTVNPRNYLTVASGAVLFTGNATLAGTGRLNFGALNGIIHAAANTTAITGVISNVITGTGGITVGSTGSVSNIVALGGANLFSGGVFLNSGILRLDNGNALGGVRSLNAVTMATGSTIRVNGTSAVIGTLTAPAGSVIENANAAAGRLRVHETADSNFTGTIVNGTGGGVLNLVKTGGSTLSLNAGNSTFTGAAVISQGAITLSGNNGRISGATSISIGGGGTLRLTNTSGTSVQGDRLINGTTVTLRGGTFDFDSNAEGATSYAETIGQLNISAGANTVTVDRAATGRTAVLTSASLARTQGAVVTFTSQDNGTTDNTALGSSTRDRLLLTAVPTLNDGIIGGWAFGGPNGANFATYLNNGGTTGTGGTVQASVGYVGMTTSLTGALVPAYSDNLAVGSWTTATNVRLLTTNATAPVIAANTTVNSLVIATNPTTALANNITINASQTLTVDSGGLIYFGSTGIAAAINGPGNITAQGGATVAPDLIVHLPQATDSLTIGANIIDGAGGATGFTKSGLGPVTLSGTNTYTGPTAIVGGTLNIGSDGHLGTAPGSATAGHLKIYGGTLNTTAGFTLDANRLIEIGGATAAITAATGTNLIYNGTITSPIPTGSNIPDVTNLTMTGNIDMTLAGDTTIGGNWVLNGGSSAANQSLVTLGGSSNTIVGSLFVGRDGSHARMIYSGAGALSVGSLDPGVSNLDIGVNSAGSLSNGIGELDLSGFTGTFTANVANFRVGAETGGTASNYTGILKLGLSSVITANTQFISGDTPANGSNPVNMTTVADNGTATFTTPLFVIGGRKTGATFTGGAGSTVAIGGFGPAASELRIGYNNVGTSGAPTSSFDMSAAGAILRGDFSTITVGFKSSTSTGGATGSLLTSTDAANSIFATNIILGDQRSSDTVASANTVQGTLTFGGGSLVVSNNFTIGNHLGANSQARAGVGIANLNGGTSTVGGNVIVANTAPTSGTGLHTTTGTLNVGGGDLAIVGNLVIGTTTSNIAVAHASTAVVNITNAASDVTVGGDVFLANVDSTVINPISTGTLNLTNGTLTITGNITRSLLNDADASQSRGFINVAGGALDMTGGTILAKSLAFRSGSISNVAAGGVTLDAEATTSTTTINGATGDALILRDVTATFNVFLTGTTASTIHYENAGAGAGGTLSGNLDLGTAARNFNIEDIVANANDLTVSGIISNSAPITKIGAGTLLLSGANTFSGVVTVSVGEIKAGSNQGLSNQNNAYSVTGGAFLSAGGFSNTIGALTGAGTVQNNAVAAGTLTLGGGNATSTFSGTVQDGAGGGALNVTKTGTGAVTLSGGSSLTYTGTTTVNGGILNAGIRGSLGITVNNGTLNLSDSTAFTLNLGNSGNVLQLSNNAVLGFELGTTGDQIVLGAAATALTSGIITLDLYGIAGLAAGSYNLITAAGGGLLNANGSSGLYALGNQPSGFTYTLNQSDILVQVIVTAFTGKYWRGDVDGSWNANNAGDTNWSSDATGLVEAGAVPGAADSVLFSATNAMGPVINTTLGAAFSLKELIFLSQPAGVTAVNIAPGAGGTLTLSEGITLNAGAGNVTISAPLSVSSAQNWKVVQAVGTSLLVSGDLTGSSRVTKTNTGVLILSGDNSGFSGGFTLSGGTLNLNSVTALGSGDLIITGGAFDNTSGGPLTLTTNNLQAWNGDFSYGGTGSLTFGTGAITLGANRTVTTNGAGLLTQQGDIGGAFSLAKEGTGTLVLAGNASAYSGGTTLNAGTLVGVVTGASGTPLGAGDVTIGSGTTLALRGNGTGSSGTIAVGNNLVVGGSAILDLDRVTANTGNTFALGTLSIGASTLTVNAVNSYGVSFAGGTLTGNATITHATAPVTISGAVGGAFSLTKSGAGILALNGNSTFSGGVIQTTGGINLGHVNGLGTGTYNVTGASTLTPTVDLSAGGTGPVTNAITLDAGLTLTGTESLSLSGSLTNSSGNQTLTNNLAVTNTLLLTGMVNLTESTTARTFSIAGTGNTVQFATSVIQNGGTGASVLDKTGTGTLTLNGANTHTGGVNLSQGTLILGHQNALGTARLQTQTNNGTIQANTTLTGATALANALTLNVGTTTFSGVNSIEFNGTTTNNAGNRTITNNMTGGAQLILAAVALSNDATSRRLTIRGTADTIVEGVISNGSTSTAGNLTKNDAGMLTLLGTNTYDGDTTITAGVLQIGNGGTIGSLDATSAATTAIVNNNATLRFNRSNNFTFGNNISGSGVVEQTGAGITTLTGTNTYNGTTTISAGVLQVGNNGTVGTLGAGDVILANNAVLSFNRTDALNITNNITGTGGVRKTSTGTTTLTPGSSNTFVGDITVFNGALVAGSAAALGSAGNNIVITATGAGATATLDLNGNSYTAGTLTLGGTTATSTPVVTTGAGTLTLGGDVIYSATGNPLGGSISGSVNLGGTTRTFTVGNSTTAAVDLSVAASIAGTAAEGLTKDGAGTMVLTGANTYTGATLVSGGTLQLGDGVASTGGLASTAVTVAGGGSSLVGAPLLTGGAGSIANLATAGNIAGTVTIGVDATSVGILAAGFGDTNASNQTLTLGGNLTVNEGSQVQFSITNRTETLTASHLDTLSTALAAGSYTNVAALFNLGATPANFDVYKDTAPVAITDHDYINVTGSIAITAGGTNPLFKVLNRTGGAYTTGTPFIGDVFHLLDWSAVGGMNVTGTLTTTDFDFSAAGFTGNFAFDTSAFATHGIMVVVPEPSRMLFLILGLLGLVLRRRRK